MISLLDDRSTRAWKQWLDVTVDRCHLHYQLEGGTLETHVGVCLEASLATARRVQQDLGGAAPRRILEIGCSVGFNCFALQQVFPSAEVIGIEPDPEAVDVANEMARTGGGRSPRFEVGVGERLPLPDGTVDLILCHTVIEHVQDVPSVIAEMARVLAPGGVVHLEAPNYVWPREPHLGIWCVPLLGKQLVRLSARLQRKTKRIDYVDHLQFVHPRLIEKLFRKHGLRWKNRVREKMLAAASGDSGVVKEYRGAAGLLRAFARAGLLRPLVAFLMWIRLYPSLLYVARREASPLS